MRGGIVFLLSIIYFISLVSSQCVPACHPKNGECKLEKVLNSTSGGYNDRYYCYCTTLWDGETCEIPWREDSQWMRLVIAYRVFVVLIFAALFIWSTYELYQILRSSKNQSKLTIVTYALSLVSIGAFLRVFLFCLDPHSIAGILPIEAYGLLLNLPLIAWLSGGFGICVFWMELNQNLGVNKVEFVKNLRPFLFALVALTWFLLIPATLWLCIFNTVPSLYFYNLSCILLFAIFLAIAITFGVKLRNQLKKSGTSAAKRFLLRITVHMVAVAITLVFASATALSFVFLANNAKYPYIIIHWIIRVEEFLVTSFSVALFTRKQPKKQGISEGSQNTNSEVPSQYKVATIGLQTVDSDRTNELDDEDEDVGVASKEDPVNEI